MDQARTRSGLTLAALLTLSACGGGGGGTPPPPPPVNNLPQADAGADRQVTRTTPVTLDGRASRDADGDPLTYSWRQTAGVDVTGGSGTLSGASPSFTAPPGVQTLEFSLTVNDGKGSSAADTVIVHVLEDAANAFFVDGDAGSDAGGDGSMSKPYASLRHALARIGNSRGDVYLRTRAGSAVYDEAGSNLTLPSGTSLYGGYVAGWTRNVAAGKAEVRTNALGLRYNGLTLDTWVSGLVIRSAGSTTPDDTVAGLWISGNGTARMTVEDNTIVAGSVGSGSSASPGSSYGLYLAGLTHAAVLRNDITAGRGGNGLAGSSGDTGSSGDGGNNGNRTSGNRAAGGSGGAGGDGGLGGARGGGLSGSGGGGAGGGSVDAPLGGSVAGGSGGQGGVTGTRAASHGDPGSAGGSGVPGAAGGGFGSLGLAFAAQRGTVGGAGGGGSGGGGGGAGAANDVGVVGGGGGGGGEGGEGGAGGQGGQGGGASIGVWLVSVASSDVADNLIVAGTGGSGATGGSGGGGGSGGAGGSGAAGDSQGFLGSGGSGGNGGSGGRGGTGGRGGAGGGGPSFGLVIGAGMAPAISGNRITSGTGGVAGAGGNGGNGGEGGYSFTLYDINPFDGQVATLGVANVLTVGNAGAGGSTSGSGGSAGQVGRSGQRNW